MMYYGINLKIENRRSQNPALIFVFFLTIKKAAEKTGAFRKPFQGLETI